MGEHVNVPVGLEDDGGRGTNRAVQLPAGLLLGQQSEEGGGVLSIEKEKVMRIMILTQPTHPPTYLPASGRPQASPPGRQ